MIIAIIALVALELLTLFTTYLFYRGAVAFMDQADAYKTKYLELLVTFDKIKKALADNGILLLSAEEAGKLAENVKETVDSGEGFHVPTSKKGTVH